MGIRSEDPTKDPTKGRQDWEYSAPDRGQTAHGYYAGFTLWITVHHEHGSRPCRSKVSQGALSCPMCACEAGSKQRGFVAYYSRDLVPSFYISPDKYRLNIDTIQTREQVVLKRGKKVYDGVVMRAETFRPLALPAGLPVGDQVDLLPSLLRMWKDTQLERWHCSTGASDTPVSVSVPVPDVPEEILRRMHPVPDVNPADTDAALDVVMSRLTLKGKKLKDLRPSSNGTGHGSEQGDH